jgi:hypothetical protein
MTQEDCRVAYAPRNDKYAVLITMTATVLCRTICQVRKFLILKSNGSLIAFAACGHGGENGDVTFL